MSLRLIPKKPDRITWAIYATASVVLVAMLVDPSWPRWQAMALAVAVGLSWGLDIQAHLSRKAALQSNTRDTGHE